MLKRVADAALSLALLAVLGPAMLAISLAVALTIGLPVLFRQRRPGYRGAEFDVLKFRTMTDHRDRSGNLLPDRERETGLGKFLRNTSLDELPQLINVLLGQMSLVGPRPLMRVFTRDCTSEQMRRFEARPGITGWAQIHGRKALDYDKRFQLDIWYVNNQSLWLDVKIMLATLPILLRRDGLIETKTMARGTAVCLPLIGSVRREFDLEPVHSMVHFDTPEFGRVWAHHHDSRGERLGYTPGVAWWAGSARDEASAEERVG